MKQLALVLAFSGCATVAVSPEAEAQPVEVTGHVLSACGADEPVALEPVAVRVAGELEVLDSTQTDASGAFSFRVTPHGDVVAPLFIEARGVRTVAKPAKRGLIAELVLPCTGG